MWIPGLGFLVAATARAHANGDVDTFTVSAGGLVLVTKIWGVITVAPGGAVTVNVGNNPTLGTATTVVWWTGADVNGSGVGDVIGVDMVAGTPTTVITGRIAPMNFVALAGTIFVRGTAVQGTSQWSLCYIPLVAGSTVVTV